MGATILKEEYIDSKYYFAPLLTGIYLTLLLFCLTLFSYCFHERFYVHYKDIENKDDSSVYLADILLSALQSIVPIFTVAVVLATMVFKRFKKSRDQSLVFLKIGIQTSIIIFAGLMHCAFFLIRPISGKYISYGAFTVCSYLVPWILPFLLLIVLLLQERATAYRLLLISHYKTKDSIMNNNDDDCGGKPNNVEQNNAKQNNTKQKNIGFADRTLVDLIQNMILEETAAEASAHNNKATPLGCPTSKDRLEIYGI
eukprot:Pgem_evm1s4468